MKNRQQWFRNIIQCMILITGFYILYRGSGILAESGWLKGILESDKTVQAMEDLAVNTYLPGYAAALSGMEEGSFLEEWMQKLFPVLQQAYRQLLEEQKSRLQTEQEAAHIGENEFETETENDTKMESDTESNAEMKNETETEDNAEMKNGTETENDTEDSQAALGLPLGNLSDFNYLLNHYFVVDQDTRTDEEQLNAETFLSMNLGIEKKPEVPQILIYHTHSQEMFADSTEGDPSTGITGIGDYLTELLEEKYGYQVIHDTGVYDLVDGVLDRSAAYDYARASVEKILEEHPTIEVIIDLHRDGVEDYHFVTEENGKPTAQIMFFNGLSRNSGGEAISYLPNPYITENLAFSFQLQLAAEQKYPGFTRNIYLKGQRFNLHLRPRALLVESGTQLNTIEEEKNAMEVLADLLNQVLEE